MRIRVIAVGSRMPRWVLDSFGDYLTRLSSTLKLTLVEVEPGPRGGGRTVQQAMQAEAQRLLALLRKDEYVVALDEHGKEFTTRELASWLSERMREGPDVSFLIGGPDGLSPDVIARCNLKWSLSRLTFPHALVRVILAEQIYRAHSVLTNHPYHRD